MKNKKVVPVIVNGELYDGKEKKDKELNSDKVPKPSSPASNIALTLLGVILIVYGAYTVMNKQDKKEEPTSNITSNKTSNKVINKITSIEDYVKFLELTYNDFYSIFSVEDVKTMNIGLQVNNMSNNAKVALAAKNINQGKEELEITEQELTTSINNLFGNIDYDKEKFIYSNLEYTYNNETERYYLLSKKNIVNFYNTYSMVEIDNLTARVYIAYTDLNNTKSYTLNKQALKNVITKDNINTYKNTLKYFEYTFTKNNDYYTLDSITIK